MARPAVQIAGLDAINRQLAKLDGAEAKKVIRSAMKKSLGPVKARAKELAPEGETGRLRKAIRVTVGRSRRSGRIAYRISVGAKNFVGKSYYGAFREFGTKKMDGVHFMERAFDETKDEARAEAERLILRGILSALRG